jgi:hypothetical protein
MVGSIQSLFLFLFVVFPFHGVNAAKKEPQLIPGQYIVYYNEDADRTATNERLFFSSESTVASSDSFRVVRELQRAIAVAGINEEQVEVLKEDKGVKKVIQVSAR